MGFFHACEEVVTQMASRIQGITVEIGGDTTKLSKALESVNKSIKGTQSGLKDVNKLLKLDPSNTELVVQKQKMLKDAIEATKEKLATLKTAAQQANEQLANGEITQQQYDALQREIVETEQNLRSLQDQAATTNATLAKIDEAGEKLQNIGSSVENVGKKFLPVTAAVTGLGTAAVKTAADFDSEMSKVSAISGATGDDFDQLRAKAREMGAKTKFSASEAASAMEYMAMAGWKTSDMLNGIRDIQAEKEALKVRSEVLGEPREKEAVTELEDRLLNEEEQLEKLEHEAQQQAEQVRYMEDYWKKLEQTHEIREKTLQWLDSLAGPRRW
jgi:septation ring formation regulator EzrA